MANEIPIKFVADLGGFTSGLKKAFAATGVVAAAAGFVKLQQAIADATNELIDASVRTGVAAETLGGLRLAAEGSGQSFKDMEAALRSLPKNMGDAARGIGTAKDAFALLDVEVMNADGSLRDTDAVLRDTIAAMGNVSSATEKAALASDIFGRSGTKLLQALGGNMASLDAYVELSNEFGTKVGPEAAESADRWQREMASFKDVMRGSAQSLLDFGGDAADSLVLVQAAIVTTVKYVEGLGTAIGDYLGGHIKVFAHLARGEFKEATEDMANTTLFGLSVAMADAWKEAEKAQDRFLVLKENLDSVATTTDVATSAFKELAKTAGKASEAFEFEAWDPSEFEAGKQAADEWRWALAGLGDEYVRLQAEIQELQRLEEEGYLTGQANADALALAKQRYADWERDRALELADIKRQAALQEASNYAMVGDAAASALANHFSEWKAFAILEAMGNTAVAITRALSAAPPPFNFALAAIAGAAGGAEIATIQGLTAHSGLARDPDEIPVTLTRRERVLTARGAETAGGDQGVAALNRGQAGTTIEVPMVYGHRIFDRFVLDNVRRQGPLRTAIQDISSAGGRVGHRSR